MRLYQSQQGTLISMRIVNNFRIIFTTQSLLQYLNYSEAPYTITILYKGRVYRKTWNTDGSIQFMQLNSQC
jgi:hypothetical protein